MGNCGSQKKPTQNTGSRQAGNNQNQQGNNVNKNQQQNQQDRPLDNQIIKKIRNFDIKIFAVDDSYYPKYRFLSKNLPENPIHSESYTGETILKDIIMNLYKKKPEYKYHSFIKYKDIELNDKLNLKLDDLIKEGQEEKSYNIQLIYKGLKNLPKKINEYIASKTDYYATINFHNDNNKELVLFKKNLMDKRAVSLFKIYEDLFDPETNENINEHTSYCNALNNFYISGAGAKGLSRTFFRIALDPLDENANKLEYLADMPIELQLHPMIYVPDNYIFVVGGHTGEESSTTKVYFYDIKYNTWDLHSNMQRSRVENSLCLVNDEYLYSIFGNKNDKANDEKTIERINLRNGERIWELINLETFDLSFFTLYSVAQYKNSLLLLAVDENQDTAKIDDNNERNLLVNLNDKKISLYSENNIKLIKENKPLPQITHSKNAAEIEMSAKLDFFERSFVPIAENIMILSPYNHNKDKINLVILNDGICMNEAFSPNEEH